MIIHVFNIRLLLLLPAIAGILLLLHILAVLAALLGRERLGTLLLVGRLLKPLLAYLLYRSRLAAHLH